MGARPEAVAEAVGLMGEITRFRLDWDAPADGPAAAVIAKLPSALAENRELALTMGYYECEHRFYIEVAGDCAMRTPRTWYSAADADAGRYALIIEDVGGYERVDQMDGADPDHAAAVVDALAALHAQWWASPRLADHAWLPDGLGDEVRIYGDLCKGSWPSFAEATAAVITDDDRALAERFLAGYDTMIDRSLDAPHTLVHRDFRVDNMHFDRGEPVVFDWGAVAHGGGLYDLAYFVAGSMTIEDRRAHDAEMLARYRSGLASAGIEVDDPPSGSGTTSARCSAWWCPSSPAAACWTPGTRRVSASSPRGYAASSATCTITTRCASWTDGQWRLQDGHGARHQQLARGRIAEVHQVVAGDQRPHDRAQGSQRPDRGELGAVARPPLCPRSAAPGGGPAGQVRGGC